MSQKNCNTNGGRHKERAQLGKRKEIKNLHRPLHLKKELFVSLSKLVLEDRGKYAKRGRNVSNTNENVAGTGTPSRARNWALV